MSERDGEVGPGRVGDSLTIAAVKILVLFLGLLTIAAVLHSWSQGLLP
ncbi:MAG TPA: hypothetical protein VJ021_02410 [Thermoplasmata archaeon]|nr:hypothetical protein [Thermoplasmata archaeon]